MRQGIKQQKPQQEILTVKNYPMQRIQNTVRATLYQGNAVSCQRSVAFIQHLPRSGSPDAHELLVNPLRITGPRQAVVRTEAISVTARAGPQQVGALRCAVPPALKHHAPQCFLRGRPGRRHGARRWPAMTC